MRKPGMMTIRILTKRWSCPICKREFQTDYPITRIEDELTALELHLEQQLEHINWHLQSSASTMIKEEN